MKCRWCGKRTEHGVILGHKHYHASCAEIKQSMAPKPVPADTEVWDGAKPEWMIRKERLEQKELADSYEHAVTVGVEVNYKRAARESEKRIINRFGVGNGRG